MSIPGATKAIHGRSPNSLEPQTPHTLAWLTRCQPTSGTFNHATKLEDVGPEAEIHLRTLLPGGLMKRRSRRPKGHHDLSTPTHDACTEFRFLQTSLPVTAAPIFEDALAFCYCPLGFLCSLHAAETPTGQSASQPTSTYSSLSPADRSARNFLVARSEPNQFRKCATRCPLILSLRHKESEGRVAMGNYNAGWQDHRLFSWITRKLRPDREELRVLICFYAGKYDTQSFGRPYAVKYDHIQSFMFFQELINH
ncbi:hypothetical protein C8R44DRAFT_726237 [Mycena epipterygia]|nr:hypothetical protein C8R44DRAFT_726237 [Mycena epipterygia]